MIVGLLLYGTAVALLLALGGLVMEQLAARLGWPRRGVWAVTLLMSIAVPIAMVVRPHSPGTEMPGIAIDEHAAVVHSSPQSESTSAPAPNRVRSQVTQPVAAYALPNVDRAVELAWLGFSAAVGGAIGLSWIRLRRTRHEWRSERIDGQQLWVTPKLGPAVLGFIRPQILLPQWMMDAPLATCRVVISHEREHIEARDPLLLLLGYLAVLLVPWNLPLWWQLRRLRFAVEVDCDTRVLGKGTTLQTYGDVLISVSQRGVRAPLGSIAIAKPISQLERRIQTMTLHRPRPTRWLIGVGLTIAAACVAFAMDLPAPTLRDPVLRKPPLHDQSPYLPKAEAAARFAYPDLFKGQFDGTVALAVDLNRNGAILATHRRSFPAGPWPVGARDIGILELEPDLEQGLGASGTKFIGWFGPHHANGLYLSYAVLKWPHDPERSAARVREAVAKQYPEFFHSYPEAANQESTRTFKILTVFMNADGTINRAQLSDAAPSDMSERLFYDQFLALGLTSEQFGHRGRTFNSQYPLQISRYPNAPNLVILYAWPRRSDDPPDVALQSNAVFHEVHDKWSREIDSQVPDEVFLKRYFPDIWENAPATVSDRLWILLDRQGEVCDTGRSPNGYTEIEKQKQFATRYPTARIKFDYSVGAKTANGFATDLSYFWLDEDSKVKECAALTNR
jgi:beta-lactamase regulating signal transducer with metallopeptidase domain